MELTHSEVLMPWYKVCPGQDGVPRGQMLSGPLPTTLLEVSHPPFTTTYLQASLKWE